MIGDQLRNKMVLYGRPDCIDTAKCLQTAAEKGVDIEAKVIDPAGGDADFRAASPLGIAPALKDLAYTTSGTLAVMSYLDDKGFGPSLIPRNGVLRSVMYEMITLAVARAQAKAAAGETDGLDAAFDVLDKRLANPPKRGEFICGDFSLADIHWAACCNMLTIKGHAEVINARPKVSGWFDAVKRHPSTSKEKIVPFAVLPTAEDVQKGQLRDISINV